MKSNTSPASTQIEIQTAAQAAVKGAVDRLSVLKGDEATAQAILKTGEAYEAEVRGEKEQTSPADMRRYNQKASAEAEARAGNVDRKALLATATDRRKAAEAELIRCQAELASSVAHGKALSYVDGLGAAMIGVARAVDLLSLHAAQARELLNASPAASGSLMAKLTAPAASGSLMAKLTAPAPKMLAESSARLAGELTDLVSRGTRELNEIASEIRMPPAARAPAPVVPVDLRDELLIARGNDRVQLEEHIRSLTEPKRPGLAELLGKAAK